MTGKVYKIATDLKEDPDVKKKTVEVNEKHLALVIMLDKAVGYGQSRELMQALDEFVLARGEQLIARERFHTQNAIYKVWNKLNKRSKK